MNGLAVEDRMNANGSIHSRVLRVILRSHLPDLRAPLDQIVSKILAEEVRSAATDTVGWAKLCSFPMAKRLVTAANSLVFFGEELSRNPAFLEAALVYPEDLLATAEILRFIPSILAPLAAPFLMRQHQASKVLVAHLMPLVEERLRQSKLKDRDPQIKHNDCIQFFVDANTRKDNWSPEKIVQVILGIWFASVHQPALSLVYALDDLCSYPEYVEHLRLELENSSSLHSGLDSLPLLDSFLKESARLHPSDSISVRRKVLKPFTFSDGTQLAAGDMACIPLQAIMRDSRHYTDSLRFDAFRFMDSNGMEHISKFTDTSTTFPLWGLGKHAW